MEPSSLVIWISWFLLTIRTTSGVSFRSSGHSLKYCIERQSFFSISFPFSSFTKWCEDPPSLWRYNTLYSFGAGTSLSPSLTKGNVSSIFLLHRLNFQYLRKDNRIFWVQILRNSCQNWNHVQIFSYSFARVYLIIDVPFSNFTHMQYFHYGIEFNI